MVLVEVLWVIAGLSVWVTVLVALVSLSRCVKLWQWLVVLVPSPTMMTMIVVSRVPVVLCLILVIRRGVVGGATGCERSLD